MTLGSIVYDTYDGYGRLSMEEDYDLNEDYVYDRRYYYNNRGNRTREYKDYDQYHYSYSNANNKLTSYYDDNELVNFSYDDNGNLTSKVIYDYDTLNETGRITYEYDNFNRLISYTEGNNTTTYSYYADNLRASKTDSSNNTTSFIWNGQNLVYEGTGTDAKYYSYDITGIAAVKTGGEQKLYSKNPHNDIIGQINGSGILSDAKDFNSFGELVSCTPVSGFGYSGEYHDTESGYIYLRNRYYDPDIGRFITEDPAKDGTNWYVYCGNNPVMFYDPLGYYKKGDENLPDEIQTILNGNDKKTGGLTAAWLDAYERNDAAAMEMIADTADKIRNFSVNNINRVMVLVQSKGAKGAGHTATLILNKDEQGILLSYHPYPDGLPDTHPGEMRIAYMNSSEWNNVLYGNGNANLVGSTGYVQTESFNDNLYLSVDTESGRNGLAKLAEKFANPGNYNIAINNCDHQTASIVTASGLFYDKHATPNDSFNYTSMYYNHHLAWLVNYALK